MDEFTAGFINLRSERRDRTDVLLAVFAVRGEKLATSCSPQFYLPSSILAQHSEGVSKLLSYCEYPCKQGAGYLYNRQFT